MPTDSNVQRVRRPDSGCSKHSLGCEVRNWGMTETVSVTGNAINIDASSATLGTTVDTARLEGLR